MAAPSQLVGQTLGHYRIIEQIGAGGMGVVYRAHDEQLEREVAVKVLPAGTLADEAARKRFRKEALALAKLNHPNVETVYEFSRQDGVDFLAMELIPGVSLDAKLASGAPPEQEVLRLGVQMAAGLEAAHRQGIVHRDLKPGNLRLNSDGQLKILDFGLAQLVQPEGETALAATLTESQQVTGTLPYMAPEQLRGSVGDARSDIWAAGAVLYEMATAHRPFEEKLPSALAADIIHKTPLAPRKVRSELSPKLEAIILKCLEKEPAKRYQSASELQADLERLSTGASPLAARRRLWPIIAESAIVAVLAVGVFFYLHRAPKLTEKDTIVLADFTNTTGDPVFDGTLRQGLAVQLEQSPFLSRVSEERIQQTLRLMGQPPDVRLTPEIARDLCQRTQSAAVIDGSIASLGSQYVLGLKAVNCRTGDSLAQEQVQAARKEDVLKALGDASTKLRGKLGESLSTVQKFDTPIELATTPSLEALQAYSLATEKNRQGESGPRTLPFFKRAIQLDANFAMAYVGLGYTYSNLGEPGLAAQNFKKAYDLRGRVTEREKLDIEAAYYWNVVGDLGKTLQAQEVLEQTYLRDKWVPNDRSIIYSQLGQHEKALAEAQEAARRDPASGLNYVALTPAYLNLNRLDEARTTAEKGLAKDTDSPLLRIALYQLAFLQNDTAGMAQQVAWAAGKPGTEDILLAYEADTAAHSGRLGKAREFSDRAVASAERAEERETPAGYQAGAALREALFGNAAEARQRATAALRLPRGRDVQFGAALALAFAGDATRVHELADDLAKRWPDDTIVKFNYLPAIQAQLALNRDDASQAIQVLQAAAPYELGSPGTPAFPLSLYPVYLRGEAYLAARHSTAAAAEFQKILDHPGIVLNEPIGALAHLQLGRTHAMSRDAKKAKAAYQDFLTLWKDADPDIPILKQAKAENAKLR
jgi:serine/threonine protein kinase